MATEGLRQRASEALHTINGPSKDPLDIGAGATPRKPPTDTLSQHAHPGGHIRHGPLIQILRAISSVGWFLTSAIMINITQFIGAPLYYWSRPYYYTWMSLTKQSFAIILIMVTQYFSPTLIRVSWDSSMRGQLRKDPNTGLLETSFPERLVLIANHQIYTDWIYLWWIAYTSHLHGGIYIILKESLKYIPLLGWGMQFYGFVFMARKWETDKPRLQHRLQQLKKKHVVPAAAGAVARGGGFDPMWLLIFPEGTNLSANTRKKSAAWSKKSGTPDCRNMLLPRSTGMYFCLSELQNTVDWVYDCTVAYEGTPPGGYAQDFFTLRSTFLQGRPPKSVNFHWRRFAVSAIPMASQEEFQTWIEARWREKDDLMDVYYQTGRFPAADDDGSGAEGPIETQVKLRTWGELLQPYVVVLTTVLIVMNAVRFWKRFTEVLPGAS